VFTIMSKKHVYYSRERVTYVLYKGRGAEFGKLARGG
jgi:hypothetical protein